MSSTTECIRQKYTRVIPGKRQCPLLEQSRTGCQRVASCPAVSHKSNTSWHNPVRQSRQGNHLASTASAAKHKLMEGDEAPLNLITDCTCA